MIIGVICLFSLAVACQSILEQDINGESVLLISPPDGHHSTNYTQTMWWDEVQGASGYNLQVVSPSFSYVRKLVLDTNVTTNQFIYTFYPDTFAWRVSAFNPAYETRYAFATFYIDSTEGPQEVILQEPFNGYITNDSLLVFSWDNAINATNYRILIKEGADLISNKITYETTINYPDNVLGNLLLIDGEYTWTVRSENEVGYSEYAPERNLMVDRIAPSTPSILKPVPGDTVSSFNLAWKRGLSGGSPITDSLLVYMDSVSKTEILNIAINDTVYTYSGATNNKWYRFKVKSVDAATNQSSWSSFRYFFYEEAVAPKVTEKK